MIDLHVHTTYSDGKDSLVDVLKRAEKFKVECLSITDHNNCLAYEELKNINIKDYYSGKVITGCEFNTIINDIDIELLSYNINTDIINSKINELYKISFRDKNIYEAQALLKICDELGVVIDRENIKYDFDKDYGANTIFIEITKHEKNKKFFNDDVWKHGSVEAGNLFYRNDMSNPKSKFFISKQSNMYPTVKEIIKFIKDAGGLVFIPHAFVYGNNCEMVLKELMNNYDIDGIECYYSTFTKEQTEYLLNICKTENYYISGGSDYHGSYKPNIEIGIGEGNLNIAKEIIANWI